MGWTYTYEPKPKHMSVQEFLIQQGVLRWPDSAPSHYKVLASATVGFREFYAAIEQVDKETGDRQVWAAMILIDPRRDSFGYKDMDETMAPYYYNCPARILDLLTPTEFENARDWRARCRKTIEAKARGLKTGDRIEYGRQQYTVTQSLGRKGYEIVNENGAHFRLPLNRVPRITMLTGSGEEGV